MAITMDRKELMFVNSSIREFFQKHHEFRIFKSFLVANNIDLHNAVIVDAGCGSGYSSELLVNEFHPRELFAFDVMPEQIERARKRGLSATFFVGDVTSIDLPSQKCDAVFVFAFLHHVPQWKKALQELERILKPGGVLLIEELNKKTLDDAERYLRVYHSKESRFEWPEFIDGLEEAGFSIIEDRMIYVGHGRGFMCLKKRK
ncbi:MAG: class I SAM-dependent methyltransferase [Theionarchaea archaeon]|nr:class I SAM-dependent methyltransferase [Theionarchaea archaeon]